jgi:hypothetical protein
MMVFRIPKNISPLFAALGAFFFVSCTDFFSTSLAPWAARDPSSLIPPVTASNINDLIVQAENDPELSFSLLKKIKDARETATGPELSKLQTAALEAAVNATGLGNSLLNTAGEISSVIGDAEKARGLVTDAISGMSHLAEAGNLLNDILPKPGGDPAEFQAFTETASSESLVMSAAVLLAAESKKHDNVDEYIGNFDVNQPLNPSEQLTVNLANAALEKIEEEGAQGPLGDILAGLNLSSAGIRTSSLPQGGSVEPVF